MTDTRPRELGPVLWFALGAAVLTLVLALAGGGPLAFVTLCLTVMWSVIGFARLRRIHRYVQSRTARD